MREADTVRLFVAIELPPEAIDALREAQTQIRQRAVSQGMADELRWVAPEGIHLTLKFLGNLPLAQVPALVDALRDGLAGQEAFTLELGSIGVFPKPSMPRVIWVSVAGEVPALHEAQHRVEAALVPLGYPKETRPFSPHLTLSRVRETAGAAARRALASSVSLPVTIPPVRWEVDEVGLIRSELNRGGARYWRLAAVPLA